MPNLDRAFFFRLALFLLLIWAATRLASLFLWVFLAFTLAAAVEPVVRVLERPLGRGFAVIISYLGLLGLLVLGFWLAAPVLQVQFVKLYNFLLNFQTLNLPNLDVSLQKLLDNALGLLSTGVREGSRVLLNAAGNIGEAALALVLAVMLSLEPHLVDRMSRYLPGEGWSEALATTWARMGYWARSQAAVALVFGLLFGLWLTIVGVPTGWALGVLGGVLEVIPFIGGISVALLATIVALGKSLSAAGLVLAGYGVIALMQGKLIIPLIYGRNLGYHPAMVLLAIFVGGKLFGPLGILLGVPGLILLHNLYIVWAKPGSNQFHL